MSKPIRTFIAVPITCPHSLGRIVVRLDGMGRAVKAVNTENMHVTLKFLGDIPPETAGEIGTVVQAVAASEAAFEMRVTGLGAFPHVRRPSVVWAGLDNAEPLVRMAAELERRLDPLGFAPERRKFTPHLTLARVRAKPPAELAEILAEYEEHEFGTATIDTLEFLQSELGPGGSRYTALATAELQGDL